MAFVTDSALLDHSYDVATVRAHFPALAGGTAFFDGPGGTQVPDVVGDAVRETLLGPISNRGTVTASERRADQVVQAARGAMADLLGVDADGVVFGRSMTALTFEVARALAKTWAAGDEVVVSRLDHDANVSPWVLAARTVGAEVRWIDFDPQTATLTADHVAAALSERTRLVAVTGASNLIGTRPDLRAIAPLVHERGALLYVDGVHLTPHARIDVDEFGADFYACSPYKFLGPHCGVLAAQPDRLGTVHPDKLVPSTDAGPGRFEQGTLPYELLAGTTACVDFLADLVPGPELNRSERLTRSMTALEGHETRLRTRVEEALAGRSEVLQHARATDRTPTLLLSFAGRDPQQAYRFPRRPWRERARR